MRIIKLKICFITILLILICGELFADDLLDLWNVDSITDASWMDVETLWTADTAVLNPLGVDIINLKVGEIRFSSFGGDSGTLRIQAFFAYSPSLSSMPGFVINHGIIMDGELSMAEIFAAGLGCFALAISAPGHGSSTGGSAYHFENLVRSYPDPRNNHFYQFAYATMRGITYMEDLPMIDNDWLGAIGFSGGADAAIIANAIDSRMTFCVPIIPQTNFECGAADSGWILQVIGETDYTMGDSNTTYLQQYIAPVNYVEYLNGFSLFILGSQDEFEPLNCADNTYGLLDSTNSRLEIVANFDHHCYYTPYGLTVDYDSYDNTATFYSKILGTMNSVLTLLRTGLPVPNIPTLNFEIGRDSIFITSHVPASFWASDDVKLWYSIDSAWTFQSQSMTFEFGPPSLYKTSFPNIPQFNLGNMIFFVEVKSEPFLWLSSRPYVPRDMKFRLRPFPWLFFGLNIDEDIQAKLPETQYLSCDPNPFNSAVTITSLAGAQIEIFDINGRMIAELMNSNHVGEEYKNSENAPIIRQIIWTPEDNLGSGIYFIRASWEKTGMVTKRVIYLK